jgi:hypothetical protein
MSIPLSQNDGEKSTDAPNEMLPIQHRDGIVDGMGLHVLQTIVSYSQSNKSKYTISSTSSIDDVDKDESDEDVVLAADLD